ncbi:MAG: hypothetical protein JWR26_3240 [Pedosphaera sp.]|nr:hypothetical protein [Pedosphaera sp.]
MKTKPNSSSILHGLPPEQRERVNLWLFEENVSYEEVADRCRKIMEVKVSRSSVQRYYERECIVRRLEGPACGVGELKKMAASLGKHTEEEYSIAVGIARQVAAAEALKPEHHANIGKLNEMLRMMVAVRKEDNERKRVELHRRKVALAEKRFQFNAAIECFEHERDMKEIMAKKVEDGEKVMEIRERLFGPDLPE